MSVRMYVSKTNDVSELHEIVCACYAAATVLLWRHCDICGLRHTYTLSPGIGDARAAAML